MIVLGIESSCDETGVAIVSATGEIIADSLHSQIDQHLAFQGVVPEIAARQHVLSLPELTKLTLAKLANHGLHPDDISAVAATSGPGLIGGLMIGQVFGRGLAIGWHKPFYAINHLEAHALSPRLMPAANRPNFPYLLLLMSGGHCLIVLVKDVGDYQTLAHSLDDAIGECFDKTAKLMGLGWPGGPILEQTAKLGLHPEKFPLPLPYSKESPQHFSFSGLKSAVRRLVSSWQRAEDGSYNSQECADLALSFHQIIGKILIDRVSQAWLRCQSMDGHRGSLPRDLVVAGGVAANLYLRERLKEFCALEGLSFHAPPLQLCTDNALMVAWAAQERIRQAGGINHHYLPQAQSLAHYQLKPRWPLDELRPEPSVVS